MPTKKVHPLVRTLHTVARSARRGDRVLVIAAPDQTPTQLRKAITEALPDEDLDRVSASPHLPAERVDALRRSGRFDAVVACPPST